METKDLQLKKQYELDVLQNLIARSYDFKTIQDENQKRLILNEAEIFYRDHIKGAVGDDASHHNISTRFPHLSEKMRTNVSIFASEMQNAINIEEIEDVAKKYGATRNLLDEKLKNFIKMKGTY